MEVTLEQVANKLAEMSNQIAGLAQASAELKEQARAYREDLKDDVKRAAEGYGATLESIERRMERLELKVDQGFDDTRLLLKDHERRITSLENR